MSEGLRETQSLHPQDNRVEHGQHGLADLIAVVALRKPDEAPERGPQAEPVEEMMDEDRSPVMCEGIGVERDAEIFRATAHCCRTALLVRFCNIGRIPYATLDSSRPDVFQTITITPFSG